MKFLKQASIIAFCTLAYLTGCSSTDDESSPTKSKDDPISVDDPQKTEVDVVAGCEEITNADDKAAIEEIKTKLTDVYSAFGRGDLSTAQEMSADTKSDIEKILKKYPGNCEAQLAYVASIISDIANNKKINNFLDTLAARNGKKKAALFSKDIGDAAKLSFNYTINSSDDIRGILVSDVQSAIGSAIPSLDSAISYMTNIANDEEFTCTYPVKNRDVELDRGEFAPVLAALYVAKASLTALVSINLDVDDNGKYDWVDSLMELEAKVNYYDNHGFEHLFKLIGKDSKFTSIHDSWKTEYKNIPNLLDSAITYGQLGLQYGLEEAKNGLETQENDLYVVGDGEFADLSTKDAQKFIDTLTSIKKQLREGFEIPYAEGKTIKVNISKLFENTDGIQKFLPYHVVNDKSEWVNPDGGFYWSEAIEEQAYAQRFMQSYVAQEYYKFNPEVKSNEIYGWEDDETTGTIHMDIYRPERIAAEIGYYADGCKVKFVIRNYEVGGSMNMTVGGDEPTTKTEWKIPDVTLPAGMCKEDKGTIKYAVAYYENEVPNYGYFTDKDGKKTATIQELVNGKMVDTEIEPYKYEDLRKFIIFPDITFGGIFPDMTVDAFWDDILPAIFGDDDEEDWDEDWDDEYDY
ncbi:MAG: hypothetical protein IKP90_00765 [Fibrobacter sp.]|jgi:hypothetical protein|nr:hypothetical protein [Fibrobacter sp.]